MTGAWWHDMLAKYDLQPRANNHPSAVRGIAESAPILAAGMDKLATSLMAAGMAPPLGYFPPAAPERKRVNPSAEAQRAQRQARKISRRTRK